MAITELPVIQPGAPVPLDAASIAELSTEIRDLAERRNAVILAHNYELPEVQDVADYVGDSLGLSRQAAATDAEVVEFCGVHFMAETASILSPEKRVLIPDLDAGCSLADSINADQLRAWKAKFPGAVVVMYVNTSAEVKAETDYCCTSSNAVKVVEHIWAEHGPDTEILFGPDMWLGAFVERETGLAEDPERRSRFHVWDGECHVHAGIRPTDITRTRAENPDAEFLIHPECGCSTQAMEYIASGEIDSDGVHMLSTSQMIDYVKDKPDGSFIVATETGMLHPMRQAAPRANLIEANRMASCKYMKMITLPKLRDSLRDLKSEVKVDPAVAERARLPIERMVSIG
jgi:quinolinate synthase